MSKTNKELAVDVALKLIEVHPVQSYGPNNLNLTKSLSLESICNIIKSVHATLENLDKDSK